MEIARETLFLYAIMGSFTLIAFIIAIDIYLSNRRTSKQLKEIEELQQEVEELKNK